MLNIEAKDSIQKMKYIVDRFVKVEHYDSPKRVLSEPHIVERTPSDLYITFFSQIVSDENMGDVIVRKEPTIDIPVPSFATFTQVQGEIKAPNECIVDRVNGWIYFHPSQFNCKVSIDYNAIGKGMISSDLIYTSFDSNNHIIDTLGEMVVKSKKELDRISTVATGEQLKLELESYIQTILDTIKLVPDAERICRQLKELAELGSATIVNIEKAIRDGQATISNIRSTADKAIEDLEDAVEGVEATIGQLQFGQNKTLSILPSNWTKDGNIYKYIYNHTINDVNIIVNAYEVVGSKWSSATIDYDIESPTRIVFYDNTNTKSYKINLSASCYNGKVSDPSLINVDKMQDGVSKVVMTKNERDKIVSLTSQLDNIEQQKLNKNGIVTMANMGQDVKEAMTGGSVAVVGDNAVLENNLNPSLKDLLLMTGDTRYYNNIVVNSDFVGNIPWYGMINNVSATTFVNNECSTIATGKYGGIRQNLTLLQNHKYYCGMKINSNSNLVKLQIAENNGTPILDISHTGSGAYELLSGIFTVTKNEQHVLRSIDYRNSDYTTIKMKEAVLFDLTDIYGQGFEPTKADFEKTLIALYNSTYSKIFEYTDTNGLYQKLRNPVNKLIEEYVGGITTEYSPLFYNINNGEIDIVSKYSNSQDIRVKFTKKGANKIFDFYQIYLVDNSDKNVIPNITDGVKIHESLTDWHCPFRILAKNNINGDKPDLPTTTTFTDFTGGNHDYTGGGSGGSATGRTSTIKLYVDGREVINGNGYANKIQIKWVNFIQASNTKKSDGSGREVMKELHTLTFDGVEWITEVQLIALEDIVMKCCYGFQINTKDTWDGTLRYFNATNRNPYNLTVDSQSGNLDCDKIQCEKNGNTVEIELSTFDLGKKTYNTSNTSKGAFATQWGKVYFNLVDNLTLVQNSSYGYKGGYKFFPTIV